MTEPTNNIYRIIEESNLVKVAKLDLSEEKVNDLLAELKQTLEETFFQEYADNLSTGQVAKKYKVVVGSIGCPNCGCAVHGVLHNTKFCEMCGEDYNKTIDIED